MSFSDLLKDLFPNKSSLEEKDVLGKWFEQLDVSDNQIFQSAEEETEVKRHIKTAIDHHISTKKWHPLYFLKPLYKVAAIFILFISIGILLYYGNNFFKQENSVSASILPGTSKAVITFSDGAKINVITEAQSAELKKHGIQLSRSADGKLICSFTNTNHTNGSYSIETPIGGEFQLQLVDGSHLWMNAGSVVRFSENFIAPERKLSAKGEVYFEVAKINGSKFIVETGPQLIEVLGTHFLVNTNTDNSVIKTTLLEGSIRLTNGSLTKQLTPGQISRITKASNIIEISSDNDAEKRIAWKEGNFSFSNTDFKTAQEQIEKWYNVQFVYTKTPDCQFYGEISRASSIEDVLKMMELVGNIQFKIEGRNIYITE